MRQGIRNNWDWTAAIVALVGLAAIYGWMYHRYVTIECPPGTEHQWRRDGIVCAAEARN